MWSRSSVWIGLVCYVCAEQKGEKIIGQLIGMIGMVCYVCAEQKGEKIIAQLIGMIGMVCYVCAEQKGEKIIAQLIGMATHSRPRCASSGRMSFHIAQQPLGRADRQCIWGPA